MPARPLSGTHFTVPRRVEGWVDLDGWLHTKIKCRLRESNPDTVTHSSTNLAGYPRWSRLTRYHYAKPPCCCCCCCFCGPLTQNVTVVTADAVVAGKTLCHDNDEEARWNEHPVFQFATDVACCWRWWNWTWPRSHRKGSFPAVIGRVYLSVCEIAGVYLCFFICQL